MQKHVYILLVLGLLFNCGNTKHYEWHTREVTATAYNSLANQTNAEPNITAFGDNLEPGLKCIAVSRDLLALGFKHNTQVKIEGLKGTYLVKDKMNKRLNNTIDIYMGIDVEAAKNWGRKKLQIKYRLEVKDSN